MFRMLCVLPVLAAANSLVASDLFWTTWAQGVSDGVYRADGDGANVRQIITYDDLVPSDFSHYVGLPIDIEIDAANQEIYLVETELDTIWRTDYSGSSFTEVHTTDGQDPHQIEIDLQNRYVYWIEDDGPSLPARIGRCGLDGSNPVYLINDAGERGGGIALDTTNGYLFWTESYSGTTVKLAVWRCVLDGSNPQAIVSSFDPGTFELGSVAVDSTAQKVYWIQDQKLIRRSNYDGTGEEILYQDDSLGDRSELVVDSQGGSLYWTGGYGSKTVGKATLDGSSDAPLIENLSANPLGIAFVPGTAVGPTIDLGPVSTGMLTVSWTQPSAAWQLESSSDLSSGSWSAVPAGNITMNGLDGTAAVDATLDHVFLRLRNTSP